MELPPSVEDVQVTLREERGRSSVFLCCTRPPADEDDALPRLCSAQAIYDALDGPTESCPVRLLRGSWIRAQAKQLQFARSSGGDISRLLLRRRQELPADAFIRVAELEAHEFEEYDVGRVAVVAVSYAWETPEHPDPCGNTLLMIAEALEACYLLKAAGESDEEVNKYVDFPDEVGVFLDYCSLCQPPPGGRRTAAEDALFRRALADLELWYAHEQTTVLLLTESGVGRRYEERGWTTYESLVARILKARSYMVWPAVIDVGHPARSQEMQAPPPTPEAFREMLRSLQFTNGADREISRGAVRTYAASGAGWGHRSCVRVCRLGRRGVGGLLIQCTALCQCPLPRPHDESGRRCWDRRARESATRRRHAEARGAPYDQRWN